MLNEEEYIHPIDPIIETFRSLAKPARLAFLQREKEKLQQIVNDLYSFHRMLLLMRDNDAQKDEFLDTVKNNLASFILSCVHIEAIYPCLSKKQNKILFAVLKDKLAEYVGNSSHNFNSLSLRIINQKQRNAFYETMKDKLAGMTKDFLSFQLITEGLLEDEQEKYYLKSIKEKLFALPKNEDQEKMIIRFLLAAFEEEISEMKEVLVEYTSDIYRFIFILETISNDESGDLDKERYFDVVKDKLIQLIQQGYLAPPLAHKISLLLPGSRRENFTELTNLAKNPDGTFKKCTKKLQFSPKAVTHLINTFEAQPIVYIPEISALRRNSILKIAPAPPPVDNGTELAPASPTMQV